MGTLLDILREVDDSAFECPIATKSPEVNIKSRQIAIDKYNYGPRNPNNPNVTYWREKADIEGHQSTDIAKEHRCHSCIFFDVSERIQGCIQPVKEPQESEPEPLEEEDVPSSDVSWDVTEAGKVGYCTKLKFKSTASRTCTLFKQADQANSNASN